MMEAETTLLLNKRQACLALGGICQRTLDTLIAEKRLPVVRIGRRVMIHRDALERFARRDQATLGGK